MPGSTLTEPNITISSAMTNRRQFLISALFTAASLRSLAAQPAEVHHKMFGLIAKLTAANGHRAEVIAILAAGTRQMPGCVSYVISEDTADENSIWVTEIWNSKADHDASLSLPAVQATIAKAKPMIASFAKIAEINPVAGVG